MDHKSKHHFPFRHFILSIKEVLINPFYLFFFISASAFFYFILIAFPAKTIPGNNFTFQLSLMRLTDHLLLTCLSLITGLNLTFHLYLFKRRRESFSPVKTTSDSVLGIFSGLVASILGTATCGVCVGTIFGYFGFGTVLFLLKWRLQIVAFALFLSVISLYYLSRKITSVCKTCKL